MGFFRTETCLPNHHTPSRPRNQCKRTTRGHTRTPRYGLTMPDMPCFQPGQEPDATFEKSLCLRVLENGTQPQNCADGKGRPERAVICLASSGQKNLFSKMTLKLGREQTLVLVEEKEVPLLAQVEESGQERGETSPHPGLLFTAKTYKSSLAWPSRNFIKEFCRMTQLPLCSCSLFPTQATLSGWTS